MTKHSSVCVHVFSSFHTHLGKGMWFSSVNVALSCRLLLHLLSSPHSLWKLIWGQTHPSCEQSFLCSWDGNVNWFVPRFCRSGSADRSAQGNHPDSAVFAVLLPSARLETRSEWRLWAEVCPSQESVEGRKNSFFQSCCFFTFTKLTLLDQNAYYLFILSYANVLCALSTCIIYVD